jgi:heme/copper-type cytochrome/quinol oxidase subunit 1
MFVEKIKTYFMFSNYFFLEISDIYEEMWRNILDSDRPKMTIWRMPVACWTPKATNTLSEYVKVT